MNIDYQSMTDQQMKTINEYLENNMKKLKQVCYFVWGKNNIEQSYYDDLYDDAMEVLVESVIRFNPDGDAKFNTYLTNNIRKSYIEWYRDNFLRAKRNNLELDENGRIKRDEKGNPIIISNLSLDTPIEDGINHHERIASDFDIDDELEIKESCSENAITYLNALSPIQKDIANLIMIGYEFSDIKEKLQLSDKQFDSQLKYMRSDKYSSILKREDTNTYNEIETEEKSMNNNQTFEKSKIERYSISSIIKKMNNRTLRYDHPLQRESDQHSIKMKSNLMSDILQGNPIPALVFAEQIINGISIIWNLDGKQRSTNAKEFSEDKFKISKNVRRGIIQYQAIIKDENDEIIPDENGFPQAEWREFDIRNKRFSQLPVELQEKFMDYCFDVTLYLNCSNEDIAYHMERYNEGKQMVSSQKGIIKLGEEYARMIKGISAMPFFKENGFNYTQSKNGTIDRVCIESIMATEFLDDWKKTPEEMAEFLKQNATEEHFDNLEDTVERLEKVVTSDIAEMFDANDTFIYFSVFARFKKLGIDDGKFVEFMTEYAQSLHNMMKETEIDSETGKKKSTKDKVVVVDKINMVENLMNEFLHINKEDLDEVDYKEFLKSNVEDVVDEDDIEMIQISANEASEELDENSWMLSEQNYPAYLAIVGLAFRKDIEDKLKEWLPIYVKTNQFIRNQQKAFLHMKESFETYLQKGMVA